MIKRAFKLAKKGGWDPGIFDEFHLGDPGFFAQIILDMDFWIGLGVSRGWDDKTTDVLACTNPECTVAKAGHHFGTLEQFKKGKRKEFDELKVPYTAEQIDELVPSCGHCHSNLTIEPRHITQNWMIQALKTCEICIKQGPKLAEKYINLIISTPLDAD